MCIMFIGGMHMVGFMLVFMVVPVVIMLMPTGARPEEGHGSDGETEQQPAERAGKGDFYG